MVSVAIFTHRHAQEVDGVIDLLRAHGIAIIRVNWCQYPHASQFSLGGGGDEFAHICGALLGWLHEPYLFGAARNLTGLARDVALRECSAFWDGIIASLRCTWLNDPEVVRRASNKPYQLGVARSLGLPVPAYLITNDAERARRFVSNEGAVVAKSLSAGYTEYGDDRIKVYTRRVNVANDAIFTGLMHGPLILQKEIDKYTEVRTTVVDGECFSVEFDCARLAPGSIDMRQTDYAANADAFKRARDVLRIERWSKSITAELGLSYACIDWARARDGNEFFLECNPLGSFKWSELRGGWPITQALASAILKRTGAP